MTIKKLKTRKKKTKKKNLVPIYSDAGKILHLQSDVRDLRRELADMKVIIREHDKKLKLFDSMITKLSKIN